MKYVKLLGVFILLLSGCSFAATKDNDKDTIDINVSGITKEDNYVDDNIINIGIYPANGSYYNKEIIKDTYYADFNSMQDIGSFEVFLTNDSSISGSNFKDTWKKYYNNYTDIDKYKIGYNITYTLKDGTREGGNFLEPDIYRYGKYIYVYLYDDVNAPDGIYSHLESMEDNTILSSVKIFATYDIDDVDYITLTAFTYDDDDDFDKDNNYRGKSKYTIDIKRK